MMRDESKALQRMVVLLFLVIVICLGFAVKMRFWNSPAIKGRHLDQARVARMQTVLAAIKETPHDAPPALLENGLPACDNIQQIVADINELNRRLEKLREGESRFLLHRYQFDAKEWLAAISRGKNGCAEGEKALAELLWSGAPKKRRENDLLVRLDWRERRRHSSGDANVVRFEEQIFATYNPWRSLPGCVLLPDKKTKNVPAYFVVKGGGMGWPLAAANLPGLREEKHRRGLDATSRAVPRDLSVLVADLAPWRDPESSTYRKVIQSNNKTKLPGGISKEVGLHAVFTIDPDLQTKAQGIAECYAGNNQACKDAGISNPGNTMYENARVRQVGIALIDIATGEIEALASAESACFMHDATGLGKRPAGCPDFGDAFRATLRRDPDSLRNHALFTAAPPASTSKPIVAAGLLADKTFIQNVGLKNLNQAIWKSNTESFLGWLFCGEKGIPANCPRPRNALTAAHTLGWNLGCDEKDKEENCGKSDVLFGRPAFLKPLGYDKTTAGGRFQGASRSVLLGRLLIDDAEGDGLRDMTDAELFPAAHLENLKACARAGWEMDKINNRAGLAVVSEGRGQGSSRTTPLGLATMMANLAASAQGKKMPYPHLLRDLLRADGTADAHGRPLNDWRLPVNAEGIDKDRATRVTEAMTLPHRPGGTANKGCAKVLGSCGGDIGLASKTGTPGFDKASIGLYRAVWETHARQQERLQLHLEQQRRIKRGDTLSPEEQLLEPVAAPSRPPVPWKWYAGFFKSGVHGAANAKDKGNAGKKKYDKAFAVLVERNWNQKTQTIDDPRDAESAAVEIGFTLIQAVRRSDGRVAP